MRVKIVVLPLLLMFLVGCATMGLKSFDKFTPKQKVIYFESTYLSTAKMVDAVMKDKASTPAQLVSAQKDKETLIKLKPLIAAYQRTVDGGGIPLPKDENEILKLIDELVNKL